MSRAAHVEFLLNCFSSNELRRLVSNNYPALTRELPDETATQLAVVDGWLDLLISHDLLDAEFYALLRRERPDSVDSINALERAGQAAATPSAAPPPAKPARKATQTRTAYRWLHLTDIHFGARGKAQWLQVVDDFERSLVEWLPRIGGPVDLVLVTGDLTNRALKPEFDGVSAFFDRTLRKIAEQQGVEPLLIAVPGNHDLVRPRDDDLLDYAAYDRYVEVGDPQGRRLHERLWNASNPDRVATLFAEYGRWMHAYMLPKLAARAPAVRVHQSFFPGDLTVTLMLPERYPLAIIGLNSAWLQYQGGDFEGKLALPEEQLHAALPCPPGGSPLDFFNGPVRQALLLHHHPRSWLSPRQREVHDKAIYVPRRFAACLFGHMHEASAERRAGGGGEDRVYFQTPSLFGLEAWGQKHESRLFGYTFGSLREDGELRAWPLKCVTSDNGENVFVRDMRFHWRDDKYVSLRGPMKTA